MMIFLLPDSKKFVNIFICKTILVFGFIALVVCLAAEILIAIENLNNNE